MTFPSDEAVRVACRMPPDAWIDQIIAAAYAVDEPAIRADERRKVVEEIAAFLEHNAATTDSPSLRRAGYGLVNRVRREFGDSDDPA